MIISPSLPPPQPANPKAHVTPLLCFSRRGETDRPDVRTLIATDHDVLLPEYLFYLDQRVGFRGEGM